MGTRAQISLGYIGLITGILGVLSVIPMLAWPAQVAEEMLSYPFTPDGFRMMQAWFCFHHLGLVALLVGFAGSGAVGAGKLARGSAWLAVLGMVGLSGMEVFAMQFVEMTRDAANQGAMGAGYGVVTNLIGIGLLIAGIATIRARVWASRYRFVPLTLGLMHFLVVTPGLFMGYVPARLGIAAWMAVFGLLGAGLVRESRAARSGTT